MLWLICCVVDTDAPKISTYRNNTVLHSSDNGVADLLHTQKSAHWKNREVHSHDDAVADLL